MQDRRLQLEDMLLSYFTHFGEKAVSCTYEMELIDFAVLVHRFMDHVESEADIETVDDPLLRGMLELYELDKSTELMLDKFVAIFKKIVEESKQKKK